MRSFLGPAMTLLCALTLCAQPDRYELGRRMRELEIMWDLRPEAAGRARAVPDLQRAVNLFFTLNSAGVAKALAGARHALVSEKPLTASAEWAESLVIEPTLRLIDTKRTALPIAIRQLWNVETEPPADARIVVELRREGTNEIVAWREINGFALPSAHELKLENLEEGEHFLDAKLFLGDSPAARSTARVSIAGDLVTRVARLGAAYAELARAPESTEYETLRALVTLVSSLTKGKPQETDHRALARLQEAEALLACCRTNERYYTAARTGDLWLRLRVGEHTHTLRVVVPDGLERPTAIVFALHGAGGSESMFIDAYGNGAIVRLCLARKWILVAPNNGFGASPPGAWLDALAERWPIDKERVFLLGHSMGVMQAVGAAEQLRGLRAIALLGGGSLPRGSVWKTLPTYVGVGADDGIALAGARALHERLERIGADKVLFKEHANVEHLTIVQAALPEVFAFFDAQLR